MSSFVRGFPPIPGSSIIVRNIGSDLLSRRDISIKLLSYNVLKMFCLISNLFLVSSKLLRSYSRLMVAPDELCDHWSLQDIHEDIRDHNIQILQQNSLQLKFEITVKLNNIVQHPYPINPPNITAQLLPPPFITTEVIYKYDRYTKKTIGYITFYNPYSGLSYTCIF